MSAFFNPDEHLAEIFEAAVKLAPMCTSGIDWSNSWVRAGELNDYEKVTDRAWMVGKAFVERYHKEVEDASVRAAEIERKAPAHG